MPRFETRPFVHTYSGDGPLSPVTTGIEHPGEWRVRETYGLSSADSRSERFELSRYGSARRAAIRAPHGIRNFTWQPDRAAGDAE